MPPLAPTSTTERSTHRPRNTPPTDPSKANIQSWWIISLPPPILRDSACPTHGVRAHSGLSKYFTNQFTVDTARVYKPSSDLYRRVASEVGASVSDCMMVAAHTWDTLGAQAAGMRSALITRPGNAPLILAGVPQPTLVATNITSLADVMQQTDWTQSAL